MAIIIIIKVNSVSQMTNLIHKTAEIISPVVVIIFITVRYKPVKWQLMKRKDDPKMWKQTATAPFVLMPDGPGLVVTVASSATARHHNVHTHSDTSESLGSSRSCKWKPLSFWTYFDITPNRKCICNFILLINSNFGRISGDSILRANHIYLVVR